MKKQCTILVVGRNSQYVTLTDAMIQKLFGFVIVFVVN